MAGKKKEGLGALKDTTGGNRRDDRQAAGKTFFEPIVIDAKNALTVIYMLKSPEDNVVLRAVASLEGYAKKGSENLQFLSSLGIFEYLIPLVHHKDYIVRRFSQKLIGMLCSLEEFRQQMFTVENILNIFVDILDKETDVVMHEYAALTLAELTVEYRAASKLLKVDNCIETLFLRITSADPDVEKNCLDVINHLLNDVYGIEVFVESPSFEIKLLLDLIPSSYPVIQALTIEVLKQLTSWCKDTRVLFAFRDALGIELTIDVLENEEWADLHSPALDLLINVVDSPELCDYLLQSGCLLRLINLLDTVGSKNSTEKILGVLARMSQTKRGGLALCAMEMGKRFCSYLQENSDGIQEAACLGIANMAQYGPCLDNLMVENPTSQILEIIIDYDKTLSLRNMAAFALNILCHEDLRASKALLEEDFEKLFIVLEDNPFSFVELSKNIIQIFIGISFSEELRIKIIKGNFIRAILHCLNSDGDLQMKDVSLQVDALECLSGYLIEFEARSIFDSVNGVVKLIDCLKSKYASVREWAGHLVLQMSQSKDFVKAFIKKKGLDWLLAERNTRFSMPSWQSAIEAVLANYLPAKFALTGRLDFQDITQEGFYISSHSRVKFFLLDDFLEAKISPIFPVYVVNFDIVPTPTPSDSDSNPDKVTPVESKLNNTTVEKNLDPQNLQKFMKGADRNSLENYSWTGSLNTYTSLDYDSINTEAYIPDHFSRFIPDPYLNDYLDNLKKRIAKEEAYIGEFSWYCIHPKLVRERARIIAEFVVNEMSGSEPNTYCLRHYKEMHINELKFQLGTNIIPLGFIRMGDYLERAMLFKVLSDKIGFPCALVRGSYGRAWIEIAVPILNIDDMEEGNYKNDQTYLSSNSDSKSSPQETLQTFDSMKSPCDSAYVESIVPEDGFWFPKIRMECFKAFPNNFLKPNAIVDLINLPGKIMKLNSREAEEYCGAFLYE